MIGTLFFLAMHLSPLEGRAHALSVIEDVAAVASTEDPISPPLEGEDVFEARARTAKILLVWWWREARWNVDIAGDGGRTCGPVQMLPHLAGVLLEEPVTCAELRADARRALRLGLGVMRYAVAKCGSVRAGLGLYAGGACGARQALVASRCALAGC